MFMTWEENTAIEPAKLPATIKQVLTLPACIGQSASGVDEWVSVRHINLRYGEKSFILGFCSALQLTKQQKYYLLLIYAEKYQEAFNREKEINRRESRGKYYANSWLREGAKGFLSRSKQ